MVQDINLRGSATGWHEKVVMRTYFKKGHLALLVILFDSG
jgi:hypothetical protein